MRNPTTNTIYVTGTFLFVGNQRPAKYIAQYDATNQVWGTLGNGIEDFGNALALNSTNGNVFVGGQFSKGINLWNGTQFLNVSVGVNGQVFALAMNPSKRQKRCDLLINKHKHKQKSFNRYLCWWIVYDLFQCYKCRQIRWFFLVCS